MGKCLNYSAEYFPRGVPVHVERYTHLERVLPHRHDFFELVYFEQGLATHVWDEIQMVLTPGDLFCIRPGEEHAYLLVQRSIIYNCLFYPVALAAEREALLADFPELAWFLTSPRAAVPGANGVFGFNGAAESGEAVGVEKEAGLPVASPQRLRLHFPPGARQEIGRLLKQMAQEEASGEQGWEILLRNLLAALLVHIGRALRQQGLMQSWRASTPPGRIQAALAFMEQRFAEPLRLEEIAAKAGLSPDYFARLCKELTGLSPLDYLQGIRLMRAVSLLEETDLPIAEVAGRVGFEDPNYFGRFFRQRMGCSPTAFRRTVK